MNYKVGLLGATGRMGMEISALLGPGFNHEGNLLEFSDAVANSKKIKSIEGVPVREISDPEWEPVHVWIDFSRPEATLDLLMRIQTPVVIGTTGFTEDQLKRVRVYSETHAVLLSPNMSPGISLFKKMVRSVPVNLKSGYDIVLSEEHHRHKKDSPSGTLKAILKILREQGHDTIQVQAARLGGIQGKHTLKFVSDEEELEITHRVLDRKVFARGALLGALALLQKKSPGLYGLEELEVV